MNMMIRHFVFSLSLISVASVVTLVAHSFQDKLENIEAVEKAYQQSRNGDSEKDNALLKALRTQYCVSQEYAKKIQEAVATGAPLPSEEQRAFLKMFKKAGVVASGELAWVSIDRLHPIEEDCLPIGLAASNGQMSVGTVVVEEVD